MIVDRFIFKGISLLYGNRKFVAGSQKPAFMTSAWELCYEPNHGVETSSGSTDCNLTLYRWNSHYGCKFVFLYAWNVTSCGHNNVPHTWLTMTWLWLREMTWGFCAAVCGVYRCKMAAERWGGLCRLNLEVQVSVLSLCLSLLSHSFFSLSIHSSPRFYYKP